MEQYDEKFYHSQYEGSVRSATKFLTKLFSNYKPKSVMDFGCGIGSWLYAAENLGVKKLVGLDGEWVKTEQLLSTSIDFRKVDFKSAETNNTFGDLSFLPCSDLAISVEVAEHFDESCADRFIGDLTRSSNLII
ncbi:MAG: hypothetical protein KBT66_12390, partial [Amphritea sp.]|nr:hypothetical protein [Amphritea sp.]